LAEGEEALQAQWGGYPYRPGDGLNPRSLIKDIPGKDQQWKAPVKEWLWSIWEERQEKARSKQAALAEEHAKNV
jgi:hypothetical protein